jgi:hypothetical protein
MNENIQIETSIETLLATYCIVRSPSGGLVYRRFLSQEGCKALDGPRDAVVLAPTPEPKQIAPIKIESAPAKPQAAPVKPQAPGKYTDEERAEMYRRVKERGLKDGRKGLHLSGDRMAALLGDAKPESKPVATKPQPPQAAAPAKPPVAQSGSFKGKFDREPDSVELKTEHEWAFILTNKFKVDQVLVFERGLKMGAGHPNFPNADACRVIGVNQTTTKEKNDGRVYGFVWVAAEEMLLSNTEAELLEAVPPVRRFAELERLRS